MPDEILDDLIKIDADWLIQTASAGSIIFLCLLTTEL